MERALVVVEDTETHRRLLREAGSLAAAADAELIVLTLLSADEVERNTEAVEAINSIEGGGVDPDAGMKVGHQFASDLVGEVLESVDLTYESLAVVAGDAERSSRIVAVAEERDCDHVFVAGRHRSPTGKAIFGDTAQAVLLNFPGPVTVLTD